MAVAHCRESGWFIARLPGTEDVAEIFRNENYLRQIRHQAKDTIVPMLESAKCD